MKSIKVLAVTGIRSEYDALYPVIKALSDNEIFELKLVVSGAHLSDWHGNTLEKIQRDGFEIADKIDSLYMTNRKTQRVKGVGSLISSLAQTTEREAPDFLLTIGDREESIATAITGNYMNVLTAHIGGGDSVYGNADDPIRFAVSRLAHIHFTEAKQYAQNLVKIGEDNFRIFWVGNPSLDNIRCTEKMGIDELSKFHDFDVANDNYVVLINHPLSLEMEDSEHQMLTIMKSLVSFSEKYDYKIVASYPNTDPGSYDIIRAIDKYKDHPAFRFYRNIPHDEFVNTMRHAIALIGNSSMGIQEAPYYKLPVVNVGNRQKGRLNAGNVEFVGFNIDEIIGALEKACFDSNYRLAISKLENPYGNGYAAEKIIEVLASIDLNNKKWYVKRVIC